MNEKAQKDALARGSADWVRAQARQFFQMRAQPGQMVWPRDVLIPDNEIILEMEQTINESGEEGITSSLWKSAFTIDGSNISFSEPEEVGIDYVAKARQQGPELTGPIVGKSNAAKKIAYAAVLVPGEPDSDGEVLTADKIEAVAHDWLARYRHVDLQHKLDNVAVPVESYITEEDKTVSFKGQEVILPKGSWIMASKVSDEVWPAVEKGELTGYSVMGVPAAAIKSGQVNKDTKPKRTLLGDLGEDWVAPFVSIVSEPAVPKAKFYALKTKEAEPAKDPAQPGGLWNRVFKKDNKKEDEMDEKKIQELITEAVGSIKTTVETLQTEVASIKESQQAPPPEEGQPAEETVESLKEQLAKKDEEIETLKAGKSKALKAQDDAPGGEEGPAFKDRDGYGRYRPSKDGS